MIRKICLLPEGGYIRPDSGKRLKKKFSVILPDMLRRGAVLDIGCGEGSLISALRENSQRHCIGVDISKEAIKMASKRDKRTCWLVSDLCRLPIADRSVDCIINMLSPANYNEFDRVLKDNGCLIKVIPSVDYLKELREKLGMRKYEEKGTLEYFQKRYRCDKRREIKYQYRCEGIDPWDIYKMTPLSNRLYSPKEDMDVKNLTVDLTVIVGLKRGI